MIKIQIIEIEYGEIVREIEVNGAKSVDDRSVERAEMGLLRNMDLNRFGTRVIEVDE
jgi:hypothetical protein